MVHQVPKVAGRRFSTRLSARKRTNLIFGANTDVGKTVVSTGLVRASANAVHYVKPLQSGGSDAGSVQRYRPDSTCKTLFEWDTPASPHTVSRLEQKPVSDSQVLDALQTYLSEIPDETTTYIETAGGVLSPSSSSPENNKAKHAGGEWGWQTQADLYQPILGHVPVVLVGDGRLGGISATLTSLESLLIRGYDVAAVVVVETPGYDNVSALREYATSRKFRLRSGSGEALLTAKDAIVSLPPIPEDISVPLDGWFEETNDQFTRLDQFLQQSWEGQVSDLQSLRAEGREVLWWPFTQHGNIETDDKVTHIDSASGDYFHVLKDADSGFEKTAMFDACASWWTQGVGHGESSLALASAAAGGRYGHTIFPDVVHAPAVSLSQALLGPKGPGHGWANRVFFSDDGSTAMEVALKMGLKTYLKRTGRGDGGDDDEFEWVVCGQEDCYHGDTLGVMDVAEPSIFNEGQHPWYESKGLFLPPPTLGFKDGVLSINFREGLEPSPDTVTEFETIEQVMDVDARMISRKLFSQYKEVIEMQWLVYEHSSVTKKIASVVIEPLLLGAGGMKFVDPLWQRALMEVAESRGVPVIFDEVASGLHRVGVASCREVLRKDPDIACYAKLLTGGLLPLSVTLASSEVFDTFLGDEKGQALLHGHSYTAHPVGCVSALHALDAYNAVLDSEVSSHKGSRMLFDETLAKEISMHPDVEQCFTLGTVLAVTMKVDSGTGGYASAERTQPIIHRLRNRGVYARPLGNVIYIMASPLTSRDECTRLATTLLETLADRS